MCRGKGVPKRRVKSRRTIRGKKVRFQARHFRKSTNGGKDYVWGKRVGSVKGRAKGRGETKWGGGGEESGLFAAEGWGIENIKGKARGGTLMKGKGPLKEVVI